MRALELTVSYVIFFFVFLEISRKLKKGAAGLQYAQDNAHFATEESFEASPELAEAVRRVRSPAVILLNKYALNVTFNYLCNVASYPDVTKRLLIFAFDWTAASSIRSAFPDVTVLYWPSKPFSKKFRGGEPPYQFFQLFRARLAAFLSTKTEGFWMIQTDTIWRKNLFKVIDLNMHLSKGQNLLFDKDGLNSPMVAGGYFYAGPGVKTQRFFQNLAVALETYFLTDNTIMTQLCVAEYEGNKCAYIPFRTMTNWRWESTDRSFIADFLQYDGGMNQEGKMKALQKIGADFVDSSSLGPTKKPKCNEWKSKNPERAISEEVLLRETDRRNGPIDVFWSLFRSASDAVFAQYPSLEKFMIYYIYPYYGFYLAI
ncbi:hypothetical protein QR680_014627 [Steinernema hermaphroditum]|uniref:Nucleotide-diphospho-sugar transferase domain-containing protein n=1 Tax=Steinernema hermaphroditum TaxID=289476 RepID=A0AA39I9K9_9BILA|nr:hypothetical protein QR680_014627 [Steinernema hermaphroditum]